MNGPDLLALYGTMVRIRRFEERVSKLYRQGDIPGFVHVAIGQEATAAGACWPLRRTDMIASNHRGHGHCIAKGVDPERMFAELFGRDTGACRGRGGSMHIADPALGILGANGIVGAGLPIAVGGGFAGQLRGDGETTVAFFGDGAVSTGAFHEAVNLAALWELPVVFLCENNHYAEFSPSSAQHRVPIVERAAAYGIEGHAVAGNDVVAVAELTATLVERCRAGQGPFLVEAETYRWHGHYEGDPERYRDAEEVEEWRGHDPLLLAEQALAHRQVPDDDVRATAKAAEADIEEALERALGAPRTDPASLFDFVTVPRPASAAAAAVEVPVASEETWRTMDALQAALAHELEADPTVFVAGIDVGAAGNIFGITRGLHQRWPERVRDTPIAETALLGLGVGAAMAGLRPVVEVMYIDFLGVCLDQLLNQAAKLHFMTGGAARVPLTVRTQFGAGRSSGSQHSQSLEAMLAHIPGLTVVMPSTPADAYGLLRASIRDPNPVVFIEHRLLYGAKGPRPAPDHLVPLGVGAVVRPGRDVTVVSISRMVHEALAAAEELAGDGIDVEVLDLRTVAPLDRALVLESVAHTSRLVVATEAVSDFGLGAEVAALVSGEAFWDLDAPIERVGAAFTPAPYAPELEQRWLPDRRSIADAVRRVMSA
ncbi:MAG TPA: dehydrogenase E1 component subunit alpha/beta [Acidimicrobiales bacterium]|nr:dehydrogenase E1 component subunit alpha/beta [Acidimicrobiales bacterium]